MKSTTTFVVMLFTFLVLPHLGKAQTGNKIICYMTIDAASQGVIKGEVKRKGMEGKIAGFGFAFNIVSPRDQGSGLATGRVAHSGIKFTKSIDIASPKLMQAMNNNENLKTVTIEFWQPTIMAVSGAGTEFKFYTIKLTNASISGFNQSGGTNILEKDLRSEQPLEELTLTYQKMEVTCTDGTSSSSAVNDWK